MKILLIPLIALCSVVSAAADFEDLVKSGDAHDAKFQCDEALKYYLPAEKLEPENADLLVKIARQYALRMADLRTDADKLASGRHVPVAGHGIRRYPYRESDEILM